ncbi:nucleotidyltransferase domain-containing protein [Amycolatopsis jiangsuensis]|uniref:Putative nucleotidyltransferase n=1 Tax=Amycolatopsis jiangsuensis TaxID=1181879 RepID=A0A840IWS1_9PSEU|nr:nucleotidyltransferase domain-containing protein [Amycolatopsis jiangsuensis]MBB4685767.1 putative nucleotidyltransferase [Amycolatopsis jiangsuensis]
MFTEETREALQHTLIDSARQDERVVAAALVGSSATGGQDRWSDIDLALRLGAEVDRDTVLADWTERMRQQHLAVDHLDVSGPGAIYRVFLRADSLQVDVSFWEYDRFRPTGPRFSLLFGEALEAGIIEPEPATRLAGWAWLYALHVRSAIARGRVWQAVHLIGGMRDHVVAMACLRHGLPATQGRGVDDLPRTITDPLAATLVASTGVTALHEAFTATCSALEREVVEIDADLAARIGPVLRKMVTSSAPAAEG